jgi:hypothetical protein
MNFVFVLDKSRRLDLGIVRFFSYTQQSAASVGEQLDLPSANPTARRGLADHHFVAKNRNFRRLNLRDSMLFF